MGFSQLDEIYQVNTGWVQGVTRKAEGHLPQGILIKLGGDIVTRTIKLHNAKVVKVTRTGRFARNEGDIQGGGLSTKEKIHFKKEGGRKRKSNAGKNRDSKGSQGVNNGRRGQGSLNPPKWIRNGDPGQYNTTQLKKRVCRRGKNSKEEIGCSNKEKNEEKEV